MGRIVVALTLVVALCAPAVAAERKPLQDVVVEDLFAETQINIPAGDEHVAFAFWVPQEIWMSLLSGNSSVGDAENKLFNDLLQGVAIIIIAQADLSSSGAFDFYTNEEVVENMQVSVENSTGKNWILAPLQEMSSDLEIIVAQLETIFKAPFGRLGKNAHFYLFKNKTNSSTRLINPYQKGRLTIRLSKRNGELLTAGVEMPLDGLFIPRTCPNGKRAHVSWNFCPWSGERLAE